MSNSYFRSQFIYNKQTKPVLLAGKISLSAAAAVLSNTIDGAASVVKTGVGTYQVTLQDTFVELVSAQATAVDSAQALVADFSTFNLPAKTFNVVTKVAGVVADVTDACEIHVSLFFNDSSV